MDFGQVIDNFPVKSWSPKITSEIPFPSVPGSHAAIKALLFSSAFLII
jgi:hypothetical protein